jgi:4-hydroxybenzoate polyprenyltransferase
MRKISAYARLLRVPGIGALGVVPVIGALIVGMNDFPTLVIVFIIGALSSIFGFLVNDYVDIELDKLVDDLQKKPLVSGEISRKAALMTAFVLSFSAFFFIALLWYNLPITFYRFVAFVCILLAGFLGTTYDIYGKKIIGSDFLVAISVAFIFLFGALSFAAPTPMVWVVFLLTFENILFMNAIQNGLKDADHDYKMGVKNIAIASGVKVEGNSLVIPWGFKGFGFGLRLFAAALFFVPFFVFNYPYYWWQLGLLGFLVVVFLVIDARFLSMKTFDRSKIRRIIGVQSFLRYSLVPVMLMRINLVAAVLLILIPIVWYIAFTPLLGERMFKPRM